MRYPSRVATHARKPATYEDLLALPKQVVGEIVAGELHVSPRPASRHARASTELGAELILPFGRGKGGPGGWIILDEPELHLGPDIVVPDLAGWRRERMPELPDAPYFTLAPDWAAEVLSPSTARLDRIEKMPLYARQRVGHVWIIDATLQSLEVYRLDGDSFRLMLTSSGDAKVRAEPFDAIELDLAVLWAR